MQSPASDNNAADYFAGKARQARLDAANITNHVLKAQYLELASFYDKRSEEILRRGSKPGN